MRLNHPVMPLVTRAAGARDRYHNLIELMRICERITEAGWCVDRKQIENLRLSAVQRVHRFTNLFMQLTQVTSEALGVAGTGQTHAVRDWFWLNAGAPHVVFDKRTKKPQFSTECLVIYATDYRKERFGPAAAALYGLRKNKKVLQFLEAYDVLSRRDGRIHFSFNPAGTQTGRWTSSTKLRVLNPDDTRTTYSANAQQVPKKTPSFDFGDGPEALVDSLRSVFVADKGCVLLSADYDALELRLIAYVYGAQKIITALNEKRDTHAMNAEHVFREMSLASADPKLRKVARDCAKTVAYAVSYQMHDEHGAGAYPSLFKTLKKSFPAMVEQQANIYAARFFELHPEIKAGQASVKARVDEFGYNELTIDGRRLYYPASMRGYNQALNFPMQGTGGALVNRALMAVDKTLDWSAGEQVRAQVHDELVIQAPIATYEAVAERLLKCMEAPARIGTADHSIPATCSVGRSWADSCSLTDFRP